MDTHKAVARTVAVAVAVVLLGVVPAVASAQIVSNVANVSLSAVLAQSITVSVTSGSSVNFALTNGTLVGGDVPAVIQTSWNLNPGIIGAVSLYGYFTTPAQALSDGAGNFITTALVEGQMSTGTPTTYAAFTQTNPVGPVGGSLALFTEVVTGANKIKTRTDNLDLRINLLGQTLPAGTYTGTVRLQARAI